MTQSKGNSLRWMDIAWSQVGVHETAGPEATPEILAYFKASEHPEITSDEIHWCGVFIAWVLREAGIPNPIPKADRMLAVSYRQIGTHCDPKSGAVAIMRRPGGHHVALVAAVTKTHLVLLGGNQKDSVCTVHWPLDALVECRWPLPPVTGRELVALGSETSARAARQTRDSGKAVTSGASGPVLPQTLPKPSVEQVNAKLEGFAAIQAKAEAFGAFLHVRWPWIALGIASYFGLRMAWDAWCIHDARVRDHNTGDNTGRTEAQIEALDVAAAPTMQEQPA